mgnify:CR=1 FL=1
MQRMAATRAQAKNKKATSSARDRTRRPQKRPISQKLRLAFQRALQRARIERRWFNNRPMMTAKAIQRAISNGRLVQVGDVDGLVRVVHSTGTLSGVQYAYLTPNCKTLLTGIATEFKVKRDTARLGELFLSITSMTRDAERQELLREQGYPAAKQSTHGLGEAFDINVGWLAKNAPSHFNIIRRILKERHHWGEINFIDETKINGAFHVARTPNYKK